MSKRGNGQGSARKRGRTWTAIWTLGTVVEDGRLRQIRQTKGGFRTKTEALAYAANPPQISAQEKTPCLMDYWEVWSKTSLPKMSRSKQTAYKIAKRKVERIMLLPVDKLSINLLQETVDAKAPTYYPAKDIRVLLSHLYKRAVAEGWVPTNLAEFIVLPSLEEEELQPFSELELRKFWDAYGKGDTFVGYILLMIYTIRSAGRTAPEPAGASGTGGESAGAPRKPMAGWLMAAMIAGGLAGLIFGGELFLDNATALARRMGISESVIAITLVAGGTSLPELASSLVSLLKGKSDMALGNVIGSNIANILLILGMSATIHPLTMGGITAVDLLVVLLSSVLLFLTAFTFRRRAVDRWEGVLFLAIYAAYIGYLIR